MNGDALFEEMKRIKAIASIGLQYASSGYEHERYTELNEICDRILTGLTGHSSEDLRVSFPIQKDYPTAKVDIRGLLIHDNKILLVRESADGLWSLPGGWADVGFSPAEIIVREFKEEAGLDVEVKSLIAVFDKKLHPHPPQPWYVYKMAFHCESVGGELSKGFDVLDVNYFAVEALPPLSENRILRSQIEFLYNRVVRGAASTHFE